MNSLLFYQYECNPLSSGAGQYSVSLPVLDFRARHLLKILKVTAGTKLEAGILGLGHGYGIVRKPGPEMMELTVQLKVPVTKQRSKAIMVLAHPRPPVMQRLLRDLSSMGLDALICYVPELGEKSYLDSRVWKKTEELCLLGAMQGRICTVPHIHRCLGIRNAIAALRDLLGSRYEPAGYLAVHLVQEAEQNCFELLAERRSKKIQRAASTFCEAMGQPHDESHGLEHQICFIGPERHYTEEETALINALGLQSAHLGRYFLRSENAAVLSLGLIKLYQRAGE